MISLYNTSFNGQWWIWAWLFFYTTEKLSSGFLIRPVEKIWKKRYAEG